MKIRYSLLYYVLLIILITPEHNANVANYATKHGVAKAIRWDLEELLHRALL